MAGEDRRGSFEFLLFASNVSSVLSCRMPRLQHGQLLIPTLPTFSRDLGSSLRFGQVGRDLNHPWLPTPFK